MALNSIAAHARRVSQWGTIALGASIPVSTALDNVLLVIIVAASLLSGCLCEAYKNIFKINYLRYVALLFGLLALGTLYGATPLREALATLSKYADLICIPVFAMVLRERATRRKALFAFALSIAIIVVLSYLIRFGVWPAMPFITGDSESPTVFKLKITHGILAALGAFLFYAWFSGWLYSGLKYLQSENAPEPT